MPRLWHTAWGDWDDDYMGSLLISTFSDAKYAIMAAIYFAVPPTHTLLRLAGLYQCISYKAISTASPAAMSIFSIPYASTILRMTVTKYRSPKRLFRHHLVCWRFWARYYAAPDDAYGPPKYLFSLVMPRLFFRISGSAFNIDNKLILRKRLILIFTPTYALNFIYR